MEFSIVVAYVKETKGIGFQNRLPWKLPEDMKQFKKITTEQHPYGENSVIMGRNTWESLPAKYKPLPNRKNIVVSTTLNNIDPNVIIARTFEHALQLSPSTNIFVIGGSKLYSEAIKHSSCKFLYITEILENYECDTFFPEIPCYYKLLQSESSVSTNFNDSHELCESLKSRNYRLIEEQSAGDNIIFKKYENIRDSKSDEYQYLNKIEL